MIRDQIPTGNVRIRVRETGEEFIVEKANCDYVHQVFYLTIQVAPDRKVEVDLNIEELGSILKPAGLVAATFEPVKVSEGYYRQMIVVMPCK